MVLKEFLQPSIGVLRSCRAGQRGAEEDEQNAGQKTDVLAHDRQLTQGDEQAEASSDCC